MKTNKEAELMGNKKNSWLLAYADESEFYIPDVLHVERNDELMLVEGDEQASKEAEKAGIFTEADVDSLIDEIRTERNTIRWGLWLTQTY